MDRAIVRQRGSTYLAVLLTTAIVVAIGLSGLLAARVRARTIHAEAGAADARFLASSAVELGLQYILDDPDWRNTHGNGEWLTDEPLGGGTVTLAASDPADGDVSSGPLDPVVLTGDAKIGLARQRVSVTVVPDQVGLTSLLSALHAGGTLGFDGATVNAEGVLSTNSDSWASDADVYADVEASGSINGGTYHNGTTSGVSGREMPTGDALDFYVAAGVSIDYDDLDSGELRDVVLSPASNPYAADTTGDGVYVIDCKGNDIQVHDCRIVGTLVLLNPGPGTRVTGSVHVAPAVSNYPSILVDGPCRIELSSAALDEAGLGVNFNPPGTPFEGSEDNDTNDTYPSVIRGLVYATGALDIRGVSAFEGVVLSGAGAVLRDFSFFTHDGSFYDNPPPGFAAPEPEYFIQPASWIAVVD